MDTLAEYAATLQSQNGERLVHERRIAEAVFEAYELSQNDIALVWQTAPPRIPLSQQDKKTQPERGGG